MTLRHNGNTKIAAEEFSPIGVIDCYPTRRAMVPGGQSAASLTLYIAAPMAGRPAARE
jgi:hypothetical protein